MSSPTRNHPEYIYMVITYPHREADDRRSCPWFVLRAASRVMNYLRWLEDKR